MQAVYPKDITKTTSRFAAIVSGAVRHALEPYTIDTPVSVEHPANPAHGDFSTNAALAAFQQVSGTHPEVTSPRELATRLKDVLLANPEVTTVFEAIEVAGAGFINFYLKPEALVEEMTKVVHQGDTYGSSTIGAGRHWLIEHTSPNPNKAMHLGHLRNNVTGMALVRTWEFLGFTVTADAVDNNRGIAIARLMWGYLKFARKDGRVVTDISFWDEHRSEWLTPEEAGKRPDKFMDELYVKASEDFKNPEVEQQVRQLVVDWEAENDMAWKLWEAVLRWAHQGQEMTLKRLGNRWDTVWHEHEHYKLGKTLVEEGLKRGVFIKTGDGAVVTNLAAYNLPDTVVIKKDGTSLYITQDIALTKLKKETFKPDMMFWVVGPEQSLALKQLFAVCEQLGIGSVTEFTHVPFGYMSIKDQGKMSSRSGNVVLIDDLLDSVKQEIANRMDTSRFEPAEVEAVSEAVGVGAVKYSILKNGRLIDTAFDLETSISLDGNSGPYLQYTHARCASVVAKAKSEGIAFEKNETSFLRSYASPLESEEKSILRLLYKFPETVVAAGLDLAPHTIATYLYELAQAYNSFYNKHSILNLKGGKMGEEIVHFRLLLTQAVGQILKNGLALLGIAAPQKM